MFFDENVQMMQEIIIQSLNINVCKIKFIQTLNLIMEDFSYDF